jgi:hypothetical protein
LHGVFNYNYTPTGQVTHDAIVEELRGVP